MQSKITGQRGIFHNIDWYMIILWLILVLFGWFNIYSSGSKEDTFQVFDFSHRYGRQLIWIACAMILAIVILLIDPKTIPPFSYLIYGAIILLLIAVLFAGKEVNHAKSWFQLGGFALQPAEFAKLATALVLSRYMSSLNFNIKSRKSLMVIAGMILAPMILIILQPDMGSALVLTSFLLMLFRFGLYPYLLYGAIALIVLFILTMLVSEYIIAAVLFVIALGLGIYLRRRLREAILIFAIALLAIVFVFGVDFAYNRGLKPHQKERMAVYISNLKGIDRDIKSVGYNFYQSKVAIGSGGFAGKGYLKGTQTKMNFIPEQDTDFIFCTIGEEWGFLGSFATVSLYILLLIRIINRAEIQRSRYSQVYGYAVASLLFFHCLINIGMTIGLTPVIGIPLPFISYGGSSLWAFTIMLFIFIKQDIHRYEVIG